MSVINQLSPKTYSYKTKQQLNADINLPQGIHAGLIAQDIQNILPELFKEAIQPAQYDSNHVLIHPALTFKTVNYIELIPYLIAGIKDQQTRIDSLVAVIGNAALHSPGSQNNSGNENGLLKVSLSSNQSAILYQNEPNPFSNQTKINYFIPENTGKAALNFYNHMGTVIKSVTISQKGQGTVEVDTANLNSAIYTYSLTIDGQVIDTKRMVKTK